MGNMPQSSWIIRKCSLSDNPEIDMQRSESVEHSTHQQSPECLPPLYEDNYCERAQRRGMCACVIYANYFYAYEKLGH